MKLLLSIASFAIAAASVSAQQPVYAQCKSLQNCQPLTFADFEILTGGGTGTDLMITSVVFSYA
jgi:hypothetical protein